MAILRPSSGSGQAAAPRPGTRLLTAAVDVQTAAETAFSLLCAIEKWPVWLGFLRRAVLVDAPRPLGIGSEIRLSSTIPGHEEQLFEVDHFIMNYQLSLVGAFSVRRRLDFRVERKTTRCKVHVRLEYPAYGGKLGVLYDGLRAARKLGAQLEESLLHFKHLAEYQPVEKDELLADF
ncbi:MAG TPA: SRPBCC family protein [Candidatus Baltobacteraceae bacterium]|nr:SRPBCC family protein [Candidatus Baltobacteraceae bacterium]